MPAIISGIVFNDLNHNGIYDAGEPGISGVYVVLYSTAGGCVSAQTDAGGNYSFSIATAGAYQVFETVANPGATCPPAVFTQPTGFISSNGPRRLDITVTAAQITSGAAIADQNFGHDTDSKTIPCSITMVVFAGNPSVWYNVNMITGATTTQGPLTPSDYVDAIGYNTEDNFLYGYDRTTNCMVRIDQGGVITTLLPTPPGLPTDTYTCGCFDASGFFYLFRASVSRYYVVDLRPNSPTYMKLVNPTAGYVEQTSNYGTAFSSSPAVSDWAYSPVTGYLYGLDRIKKVNRIIPTTGNTTTLSTRSPTESSTYEYGAVGIDFGGRLYVINNGTGNITRYTINGDTDAVGVMFAQTIASSNFSDGALCTFATADLDFGDAPDAGDGNGPDNYSTLFENDGPRHGVISGLTLGRQITAEDDAYQNADATGDDISKGIQDDGLTVPLTALPTNATSYTLSVRVNNTTGRTANLYGWVDFNENGLFELNEAATTTVASQAAIQTVLLTFTVPTGTVLAAGHTFVRLRLTTQNLINVNALPTDEDTRSLGAAYDGEVEDYILTVEDVNADISVVKTSGGAVAGETIKYTLVVANAGPAVANDVTLTDDVPASVSDAVFSTDNGATWNLWSSPYSIGAMAVGSSRTILIRGDISADFQGTITNTATVETTSPDPNPDNNTSTDITTVTASADLAVQKHGSALGVRPGEVLAYSIVATNLGPSLSRNVVITDAVSSLLSNVQYSADGGATWQSWSASYSTPVLAVGAVITLLIRGTVINTATGNITNTADITSATPDPDPSNNSSSISTPVTPVADLSIAKSGVPNPVNVGQSLAYTLTASNAGPSTAANVIISDIPPAGLNNPQYSTDGGVTWLAWPGNYSVPSLTAGSSVSIRLRATVDLSVTGSLVNTAMVSSDTLDPNPDDNSITITTGVERPADVYIAKTAGASVSGGTLIYTLTVGNNGPVAAENTVVTDAIPASLSSPQYSLDGGGTWSAWTGSYAAGTLPVSSPVTLLIRGSISPSFQGTITNTARVAAENPDPDPSNNTDTNATTPAQSADVSMVKTVNNTGVINPGDTLVYTLTAANAGPSDAQGVVISDPLPSSLQSPQYSSNGGGTWLTWSGRYTAGTIVPGDGVSILLRGTVAASASGSIANTATANGTTPDPDPSNNMSTTDTPLGQLADLSIVKTASPSPAVVGQSLTYTVTAHNAGPSTAVNIVIADALAGTLNSPQYSTDNGATWLAWGGSYRVASLASGSSTGILIRATADLSAIGSISNTATVNSDTPDPDPTNNTVTITTPVERPADVYIIKTASAAVSGNLLMYTLTVGNNGPVPAENTVVTDAIPAMLSNPQYSLDGGGTWSAWPGSYAVGTLAVNSPATILIRGTIPASFQGTITNTARVASDNPDPDPSNNTSTNTATPDQSADVSMVKTVNNTGVINPGDTLVYTLTAANAGPSDAQAVVISDPLPSSLQNPQYSLNGGGTWLTWSGSYTAGTMVPNAVFALLVRGVVAASASGSVTNTATANGSTEDPDPANNTSTTDTPLGQLADLSITKTATPSPATVGQLLTFTVTAHNAGPSTAVNVVVSDIPPTGLTGTQYSADGGATWTAWPGSYAVASLASGSNVAILIRATVDLTVTGSLSNTATVASDTPDPDPTNNTITIAIPVERPADVYITKTAGASVAGGTLMYTLTVGNNGPVAAENTVVTDAIPATLTNPQYSLDGGGTWNTWVGSYTVGTLAVDSPITVLIRGGIPASFQGTIANTARVASDNPDPDPTNNTATNTTTPDQSADVSMVKTVNNTGIINPGDTLVYTLTAANAGPSDSRNVAVNDPLPAALQNPQYSLNGGGTWLTWGGSYTVGTMAPSAVFSLLVRGTVAASASGTVTNTAKVTSDTPDPDPGSNTSTTDTPLGQLADLSITKTASPSPATVGQPLTYTVTAKNAGPSTAVNAVITDILAAGLNNPQYSTDGGATWLAWGGSYAVASLASGGSVRILVRATVDLAVVGSLSNTATVASDTPDPDPTNNTVSITTGVERPADVRITKTAGASVSGNTLTYTLTVGNNGPVAAENTVVTDNMPAPLLNPQYSLDGGGTWNAWTGSHTIGMLAVNSPLTILIRATIPASFQGTITNTAKVTSDNPDPDPDSSTDTDTTTPDQSADMAIVKTVNNTGTVNPNDTLAYTLTVSNAGPSDAQNVLVADALPAMLQNAQYSLNGGSTWLTWSGSHTLGTVAANAVITLLVRGAVIASASGDVVNTATVRSRTPDPDPDNNASTTTTPLGQLADVSIVKTASANPVTVGQVLTYTLAAANAGPSVAQNVVITDAVPAGLTNPEYSTDNGANWIAWSGSYAVPSLASGARLAVLIRAAVALPAVGNLPNTALIASDTPDPDPTNNTSTVVIRAENFVELAATKIVDKSYADVGDTLIYTFTIANTGSTAVEHVTFADVLPVEVQYVPNSLQLDNALIGGTPANASLGLLSVGNHSLTFRVTVLSLPAANPIVNRGSFAYDYLPAPGDSPVSGTVTSNSVTTRVNTALLTAQKAVDKAYAKLADGIVYSVLIRNTGNVAAQDIVLTDLVPDGGVFVPGSLTVDGVAQPSADPNVGAPLSDIAPGSVTVVAFRALIDHVPAQNPMVNTAEVRYDYRVDPNGVPVPAKTLQTNEVTTQVNSATVTIAKAADRQYADIGDVVTYTVSLVNVGSVSADEVVFKDILASGLSFVAGTLRVNGMGVDGDIAAGVPLGSVQTNAEVQFQAVIGAVPPVNPIPNVASVSYTYVVDPTRPPAAVTILSNKVDVQVNTATGTMVKTVSKAYSTCGDTLVYTSRITNTGTTAAENVMFSDLVPVGSAFVPGSFTVNGVRVPVADPGVPVTLGRILPGSTAVVVFDVTVVCG